MKYIFFGIANTMLLFVFTIVLGVIIIFGFIWDLKMIFNKQDFDDTKSELKSKKYFKEFIIELK